MKRGFRYTAILRLGSVMMACVVLACCAGAGWAEDDMSWQITPVSENAHRECCPEEASASGACVLRLEPVTGKIRAAELPIIHRNGALSGSSYAGYRDIADKDCSKLSLQYDEPLLIAMTQAKSSHTAHWQQDLVLHPRFPLRGTPRMQFHAHMLLKADLPPGSMAEVSLIVNGDIVALGKLTAQSTNQDKNAGENDNLQSVSSLFKLDKTAPITLRRPARRQFEGDFRFLITLDRNNSEKPAAMSIHELEVGIAPVCARPETAPSTQPAKKGKCAPVTPGH